MNPDLSMPLPVNMMLLWYNNALTFSEYPVLSCLEYSLVSSDEVVLSRTGQFNVK
ncbi:hypothetical protein ACTL6P_00925 [Endozoicomonas acroporae]|uniref:hypothetical protein n=1 Tax=Endozoicomonas acroporae TaxID=1701104 RepID=UPI0013D5587D|nr:hypothetical protein [Endozoicomonas acroporae]